MRWALSRGYVECFSGRVPHKLNRTSVEGTLLHELLERFNHEISRTSPQPFRPRRVLLDLISVWTKDNAKNPRINSRALAAKLHIEEILRAFCEAQAMAMKATRKQEVLTKLQYDFDRSPNNSEAYLRDPESKLCGRADLILKGEIVDFKSGDRHDSHVEQLKFYGALYLAVTKRVPAVLLLVYTAKNETLKVATLNVGDFEHLLKDLRQRAKDADELISAGKVSAKPEPGKCAFCNVRGICDSYWLSRQYGGCASDGALCDYTPTERATSEQAVAGIYIRDEIFGLPSSLFLPQEIIDRCGNNIYQLRILSLRQNINSERISLVLTEASEIYYK